MTDKYVLVIDEGTTGTRALIVDHDSHIKAQAYTEFTQYHPAPDRVEHDAEEIWQATLAMVKQALREAHLMPSDIAALGITNQRATTIVWDRATGKPITPAIVWQDTRTASVHRNDSRVLGRPGLCPYRLGAGPGLFSFEPALDYGQRARCAGAGRSRRAGIRHNRFLAHLQADRRQGACHRGIECICHRFIRLSQKRMVS